MKVMRQIVVMEAAVPPCRDSPSPTATLPKKVSGAPLQSSTFVDFVRANRDAPDCFAFQVKGRSEIRRNVHRVNGAAILSGEPMDFVGAQAWIKRVLFENLKRLPGGLLLVFRELAPTAPERF